MVLPEQPVTLTAEQLAALNRELGTMRHDINNNLSLILAAVELIRAKPHMTERMITTLLEQPPRITLAMQKFSAEFEKTFLTTLVTQQRRALPIAQKELQIGADPVAKKYAQQVLNDVNGQMETLTTLGQPT